MIHTLYIEQEIQHHPRVKQICARFPQARKILCNRYGEIFNRKAQNFRLQKQQPALILAKKFGHTVLPAPQGYGIGGEANFYFSHMLNCIYDCRYCFLQGMYRSANYVLFINYETFEQSIVETVDTNPNKALYFFSGYDCDSLALEPVTRFVEYFLPVFNRLPNAWLELRTKSTQIRTLLNSAPIPNCIVAYSFSPDEIAQAVEHKAPNIQRRLDAIVRLQEAGWNIGLRIDPLIYQPDYQTLYTQLFATLFQRISAQHLHSVSLGTFRLPETFYRNMVRLYPTEQLFAGPLEENNGMIMYRPELEQAMVSFCSEQLLRYIPEKIFFPCIT